MNVGATLRDGARVRIRPIDPGDRDALAAAFERLSPESRYRRFFAPVPRLTGRQLDYLTRVDHHHHEALVAFDEGGEMVGVARYVKTGEDAAEPAVVVADDWQGRGLGGILLDALVERAQQEGVQRFIAPVLADNRAAITLLQQLGPTDVAHEGHQVELTIELPDRERGAPVLSTLLRSVAAGVVVPARVLGERVGLLARPPTTEPANVVVVGTDGGEAARSAVALAGEVAAATGAEVVVVAAHRPLLDDRTRTATAAEDAVARLRERGLSVTTEIRRGDAPTALLDAAVRTRARLLVVGSGPEAEGSPLLSSVWDAVAHRAPCNVLIARGPGRPAAR